MGYASKGNIFQISLKIWMFTAALFVGGKTMAQSECLSVGCEWMSPGPALQWDVTAANKCNTPRVNTVRRDRWPSRIV